MQTTEELVSMAIEIEFRWLSKPLSHLNLFCNLALQNVNIEEIDEYKKLRKLLFNCV